jgi:hypothetical protein
MLNIIDKDNGLGIVMKNATSSVFGLQVRHAPVWKSVVFRTEPLTLVHLNFAISMVDTGDGFGFRNQNGMKGRTFQGKSSLTLDCNAHLWICLTMNHGWCKVRSAISGYLGTL